MTKEQATQHRHYENQMIVGDCREVLAQLPDDIVDLCVTSPPYADARKSTYGGVCPEEYVEWFLPRSEQIKRVLKPTGTFILNIKEKVVNGERHTYVLDLIKALRVQGWLWTEEFCWAKKNAVPGKWPNRFRDSWERLLQFNIQRQFAMYQDDVMVPIGDWSNERLSRLTKRDRTRRVSAVKSPFGTNMANWIGRKMVYPSNVLHVATEGFNRGHSAVFPKKLPAWFIRLFTQPGDLVLDAFAGSGTTCVAAQELGRKYVGIDIQRPYCELAKDRIRQTRKRDGDCWGLAV